MVGLLFFVLLILCLYFLSRLFIQKIFTLLFRLTKDRKRASILLGIIFLPGTFVHEISHFLSALFLFVPVGRISLVPEFQENGIKLGSVEVGKTDFLRGTIIGLAPLMVGSSLILWIISYSFANYSSFPAWIFVLLIFLIFQITHTMFASRSDVRSLFELLIFLILAAIFLVIFRITFPFQYLFIQIQNLSPIFERLSFLLLIPIGIEILFLGLFRKVV